MGGNLKSGVSQSGYGLVPTVGITPINDVSSDELLKRVNPLANQSGHDDGGYCGQGALDHVAGSQWGKALNQVLDGAGPVAQVVGALCP